MAWLPSLQEGTVIDPEVMDEAIAELGQEAALAAGDLKALRELDVPDSLAHVLVADWHSGRQIVFQPAEADD